MHRNWTHTMFAGATLFIGLFFAVSAVRAERDASEELRKMFGMGVHHYNAGQYVKAYDSFTRCVDGKTQDPSVFYYRGLALMQLGRAEDAGEDFQRGAELEIKSPKSQTQVGYDLMNIQGPVRQKLEEYRTDAKLAAYEHRVKMEGILRRTPGQAPAAVNYTGSYDDTPVPGSGVLDDYDLGTSTQGDGPGKAGVTTSDDDGMTIGGGEDDDTFGTGAAMGDEDEDDTFGIGSTPKKTTGAAAMGDEDEEDDAFGIGSTPKKTTGAAAMGDEDEEDDSFGIGSTPKKTTGAAAMGDEDEEDGFTGFEDDGPAASTTKTPATTAGKTPAATTKKDDKTKPAAGAAKAKDDAIPINLGLDGDDTDAGDEPEEPEEGEDIF